MLNSHERREGLRLDLTSGSLAGGLALNTPDLDKVRNFKKILFRELICRIC